MPPANIAAKIADALGVTIEYLLNGQELKKQENNIGAVIQILVELSEQDVETVLAVSRVLKKQTQEKVKVKTSFC